MLESPAVKNLYTWRIFGTIFFNYGNQGTQKFFHIRLYLIYTVGEAFINIIGICFRDRLRKKRFKNIGKCWNWKDANTKFIIFAILLEF
ncbi:unnamed protein product [Blepharisma stoltei]|uniref:Uncharacterized protein n=1 Tax=Blepharisma stoltei TaxID=1481888 RepID=A0AAU9J2Q4_9CILI|nr:unnamed protein product [Blepharisma stoltei]